MVPEDDGWNFEPYKAVEYKGYIIGRGATDNKGQLAPDSGFPVGYGGRGSVKLTLRTKTPLYGSTSDLRGSMPAKISQALLEEKLVDERDQYILDFLYD